MTSSGGTAAAGSLEGVGRINTGKIVQSFACAKTTGIAVTLGQKYRVTASMRSPANAGNFRLKVAGLSGTGSGAAVIDDDLFSSSVSISGSSNFRQMTGVFTIPSGVAAIRPAFVGETVAASTGDQIFQIDHLFIIRDDNDGRGLTTFDGTDIAWADLYGDWREEIITSYGSELRIYSTSTKANDRRVTLMQDPIYRADVAHVAMGYDQVPTTSYTLAQPVGQNTLAISPDADVMVRGGIYEGTNFSAGADSEFLGAKNGSSDVDRKSFLRFNLAHVPAGKTISKATLRLWVAQSHNPINSIHFVSSDSWQESSLTWRSPAPSYDPSPLDSKSIPNASRWLEFDVTSKAQSELIGDGYFSLGLVSNADANAMYSSSRGSHPPHLLIKTSTDEHATIAHWRFESDAFLSDSSGLAPSLSTAGTAPAAIPLPSSGAGSKFSNPLPQTNASNNQLASLGTSQAGNFHASDATGWMDAISETDAFTLEAYVNMQASYSSYMYIVSQWVAATNARSFTFGVDSSGKLLLMMSPDGTSGNIYASNITLATNKDYYVAVSFDAANQSSGIRFHVKNLTDNGPLQSYSLGHSIPGVINSSAAVNIGTYNNSDATRRWKGLIDEVRISDAVLPAGSLLISAP